MDLSTFLDLDQAGRSDFLRLLMRSLGCTYVCFWIYIPNSSNCSYIGFGSCLKFLDGLFHEEVIINTQLPSSSAGSNARRLFDEYRQSTFTVADNNGHVPGIAFKNSFPYLELQELNLRRLTSNDTQRRFYEEARIKTAVFMGYKIGEIELGLSNVPQFNMKMELRSWFREELPSTTNQSQLAELNPRPLITDPNQPSSSSSFSIDSPEYSSLLFNIPTTSSTPSTSHNIPEILSHTDQVNINPPPNPLHQTMLPHQQAMHAFARLRNSQFPNPEIEEAAMTKAILAILTSTPPPPPPPRPHPSSSSSSHQASQTSTYSHDHQLINPKSSAFKSYIPSLLGLQSGSSRDFGSKKSMFKRSVSFFRGLNFMRSRQRLQVTRPSTTQLHHMISERKRREKLNESFHALRSLLPPGTKKDKASLLNTTREYLSMLKAQIEELSRRNKELEARLHFPSSTTSTAAKEEEVKIESSSSDDHQRVLDVRLRHVSESTSEEAEIFDLQVTLRAAIPAEDLVLRILEFLKQDPNVSLISMEAKSHGTESTSINRVTLRLRVEGSEWDESAFQEAVRRVVADLAQ